MDQPQDPDLTIVLIGKTGAGKSASGNTILGREAFTSKLSLSSVTKTISEETGDVFGKRVRVVDTPGILDYTDTEKAIKNYCQELLQSPRRGRCLFLVTVRAGRFTREDVEAVRAAQRAIGPQGLRDTYLLFTGGDALQTKSVDDYIFKDEERGLLPDVVRMFKGAHHLFNNESEDEDQVFQLLLKAGLFRADSSDIGSEDSEERRIVLLGRPAIGKRSSGNTILRSQKFKTGCDFNSVSQEYEKQSAVVEGRNITVVDTPGISDEILEPEDLYMQIMKGGVEVSPGPHAFIIVVRLGRIGRADSELFKMLRLLFGSDATKHSMVLFTHGDELGDKNIEELIKSNSCVSELVSACGGRYCVFDNKAKQNRGQVSEFLKKIDQMVTANGGQHFTNSTLEMVETFKSELMNQSMFLHKKPVLTSLREMRAQLLQLQNESDLPDKSDLEDESVLSDEPDLYDELVPPGESFPLVEAVQPDDLVPAAGASCLVQEDESVPSTQATNPDGKERIWTRIKPFLDSIWTRISTSFDKCPRKMRGKQN